MKSLWIRYGGSNRKMARHASIIKNTFPEFLTGGSRGTGHWSNRSGTINDTPENRAKLLALKPEGIRIDTVMQKVSQSLRS